MGGWIEIVEQGKSMAADAAEPVEDNLISVPLVIIAFENKLKVRLSIQATTALAETTAIADFRSLTVFSAIYVVYCT